MTDAPQDEREPCSDCHGGELYDLLGHDAQGHTTANCLARSEIWTLDQLRGMSNEDLRAIRHLGAGRRELIRTRLGPRRRESKVDVGPELREQILSVIKAVTAYDQEEAAADRILELVEAQHHCASCGMHSCGDLERQAMAVDKA